MYSIRKLVGNKCLNKYSNFLKILQSDQIVSTKFYSTKYDDFVIRHIGSNQDGINTMLKTLNLNSIDELTEKTVPIAIQSKEKLNLDSPMTEHEFLEYAKKVVSENQLWRSYIGMGYFNCHVPPVILRNVFENAGWITQYTPYQAELSQGRLESLINYQTMICDLTGLDIANASLLDEGTAAAEAVTMCYRQNKRNKFLVSDKINPQTIDVLYTRAKILDIQIEIGDLKKMKYDANDVMGIMFQYPDTEGSVVDYENIIKGAKNGGALVTCVTDLLALCVLKSPKDLGVDIALGNAQRFGVPLGFGGPHAAFFACSEKYKRHMPGRLIGISKDATGKEAYRLSLQTREQHIRQDKATSNICTAQALLANMNAMYAIYHGPKGLKQIANRVHNNTLLLAEALKSEGHQVINDVFFDTLKIKPKDGIETVKRAAEAHHINLRYYSDNVHIGVSLDETVSKKDMNDLLTIFQCNKNYDDYLNLINTEKSKTNLNNSENYSRRDEILKHAIFNQYHSEALLIRYLKRLENKDVSLVHGMIPLGSCTMKLNATTELMPCSWKEINSIHPFVPKSQIKGYLKMFNELERDLCEITGFAKISLQPNSGSQGEYVIKFYKFKY